MNLGKEKFEPKQFKPKQQEQPQGLSKYSRSVGYNEIVKKEKPQERSYEISDLLKRLEEIDNTHKGIRGYKPQLPRLNKLKNDDKKIAIKRIRRHVIASDRLGVPLDSDAIRGIINGE